jgi:capsular polysaccharide biosynthesis protein
MDEPRMTALTIAEVGTLIGQGRLAQAEAACLAIIAHNEEPTALYYLGYIAQQSARPKEGIDWLRRAISAPDGDTWGAYLRLGVCFQVLGRLDEAYDALLAAAAREPADTDIASLLLEDAIATRGFAHAQALYTRLFGPLDNAAIDRIWIRSSFAAGQIVAPKRGMITVRQMRAQDWAEKNGAPVVLAGDIEQIPIETPPPDQYGGPALKLTFPANPPYVAQLSDVTIFSRSHIVLTADGVALNEAGAHPRWGRMVSHTSDTAVLAQRDDALLLDTATFTMRELDAGIMLCGPASDAWGHWIGEYLPRLDFYEHHPDFAALPIIVDAGMPQSHLDHLAAVAPNRLVVLQPGEAMKVGKLLYAPAPTFFPIHILPGAPPHEVCQVSPRAYRYLKDRVEASLGVQPATGGKYYLSRAGRSWRRIRNQDELTGFLEAQGFKTVEVETLSFADQVRLFQDAAVIVAPNGSAQQSIIYAPKDVRFLILSQSNLHNQMGFYSQTRPLGYNPQYVCGTPVGDDSEKHVDYVIPVDLLASALGVDSAAHPAPARTGWLGRLFRAKT